MTDQLSLHIHNDSSRPHTQDVNQTMKNTSNLRICGRDTGGGKYNLPETRQKALIQTYRKKNTEPFKSLLSLLLDPLLYLDYTVYYNSLQQRFMFIISL